MEDTTDIVFLRGRKVNLRPMCRETDLDLCTKYINDPEVRQYLASFLPLSKEAEASWFDSFAERNKKTTTDIILAIVDIETGKYIGSIGLHQINWRDGRATTGTLIGDKTYWNRGYGTDAKMILLDYAFNTLGLRKIDSAAFAPNKRSINYSLHCGYKVEGVLKKHAFRDGRFQDYVLLAVFKKDWLPIWRRYRKTGSIR